MIDTMLDRLTAGPRRRQAEAAFFGRPSNLIDGAAARLFFSLSAREWLRREGVPGHDAPFLAGLSHCRAPSRVLDLGSGTGLSAAAIAREFPSAQVSAVDGSRRMVQLARERHREPNLTFHRGRFARLPFPARHFDLIGLLNALPEMEELSRVSADHAQVLLANTYFGPLEGEWLERWSVFGFGRIDKANIGEGSWQLFERGQQRA